ncbi:MAG: hypothetical protein GXP49_17245 [Deltaproteobacteria bacterium]|nr:hypothetical protein [Deltaproteobacteria bacterium]
MRHTARASSLDTVTGSRYDRVLLVFSDIEMGSGGDIDDFPHTPFLGELLSSYLDGPLSEKPIDFVFNGDTFDLLKTPYGGTYPHHITSDVALAKVASISGRHPKFFEAIRDIVNHPSGNKSVHFIVGNHDVELLFPEVQDFLKVLGGGNDRILFHGFEMSLGKIHIEHGSQLDPLFHIDPDKAFVQVGGKRMLNISWAMVALLDVYMPLHPILYLYDRLCPKELLLQLLPEVKDLLLAKGWRYWSKDFWRELLFIKDPLLKFNWTVLKETMKRFTTSNPNVYLNKKRLKKILDSKPAELFIIGHLHEQGSYYHGKKRLLQSGCIRDEYFISDDGKTFTPKLKSFYEVFLKDQHVVGITGRELQGPARPPESFPDSIFDMVPKVKELLGEFEDLKRMEKQQEKQEKKEQAQGKDGNLVPELVEPADTGPDEPENNSSG